MLQISDTLFFVVPLLISALTLATMHWYPWHGGQGARALKRTTAYALGTLVIVGVPVATMVIAVVIGLAYGTLFWAALLVANTVISGTTVNITYWIDSKRALSLEDTRANKWD